MGNAQVIEIPQDVLDSARSRIPGLRLTIPPPEIEHAYYRFRMDKPEEIGNNELHEFLSVKGQEPTSETYELRAVHA